ncbi:MAG: AAA family ATPase [Nanoarchaeota archaeon]|nr:AAA family ATPase [Nanoarchaeota archaeon]
MMAVILAAGERKSSDSPLLPPCLQEIQGKKIIEYQLEALRAAEINSIIMVVGHQQDKIREYLGTRVQYVENKEYATTGSAYSLWLTRESLKSEFLCLNSNLIFEKEVLQRVVNSKYPDAFGFDRKYHLKSSMQKVVLLGDRIIHHGRVVSEDIASGEVVGPVKISSEFSLALLRRIEQGINFGEKNLKLYPLLSEIAKYCPLYGVNITGLKWSEIDTLEDLHKAELVFGPRKPFVVIMFGNPATGKTHTSRALQEHCSAFHRTALLSTFNIREELGLVNLYSDTEREVIYEEMMNRVNSVMKWGTSNLVLDGNFNTFHRRKEIYDVASKYGYQIFVVHCEVSHEQVIQQRLEQRKKMPKSLEHAAATMDLYHLIKQTTDPLEMDLRNGVLANVVQVNSELETVSLEPSAEQEISYNVELIQNGIKYGFGKIGGT